MTEQDVRRQSWVRIAAWLALVLVVVLLGLRLVHLNADFPLHSRWQDDGAKYTDEGWYASAAINSIVWGRWYVPGDWAPAVVMPVWPAILRAVWSVTGLSISAARGVEVIFSYLGLLFAWLLYRREGDRKQAFAFLLLFGASALQYAFGRLAILEMPMIAMVLACLLVTTSIRTGREVLLPILLGLLLPLAILTKTTTAFLLPAIFYPLWFRFRGNLRVLLRPLVIAGCIAAALYGAEQVLFASHYRADAHEFFSRSQGSLHLYYTLRKGFRLFYRGIRWIDPILFPIALAGLIASWWMRELWDNVLWGVSVMWCVFFSAFIIYHFDAPPRYFGSMTVPVFMMAVMFTAAVWRRKPTTGRLLAGLCVVAFLWNAGMVVYMNAHPTYELQTAADQIRDVINAHPEQSRVMTGHGVTEVEMVNGEPAINDGFGTMDPALRVQRYHPGWVVIWNDETVEGLTALRQQYDVQPIARYNVFDQPERNVLEFYRVVTKGGGPVPPQPPVFAPFRPMSQEEPLHHPDN